MRLVLPRRWSCLPDSADGRWAEAALSSQLRFLDDHRSTRDGRRRCSRGFKELKLFHSNPAGLVLFSYWGVHVRCSIFSQSNALFFPVDFIVGSVTRNHLPDITEKIKTTKTTQEKLAKTGMLFVPGTLPNLAVNNLFT